MKKLVPIIWIVLLTSIVACTARPTTPPLSPEAKLPQAPVEKPATAPAQESFQLSWDRLVGEARREGKVVIYSSAPAEPRDALTQAFRNKFGFPVEMISGSGSDTAAKLLSERRAGLYMVDLYIGGTTTIITQIKPAGVLEPLEPQFMLPELTDPEIIKKTWWNGQLLWVDKDRTVLQYFAYPMFPITVNTEQASVEELKSYRDLLNPKWKNKIVMHDPTVTGSGQNLISGIEAIVGLDLVREIAKQEPTIIRDRRQLVEWVARGKVAMALGAVTYEVNYFKKAGAPLEAVIPKEGTYMASGHGSLELINKAPHPKAAKLLINWLLSKEGQEIFSKASDQQSAREDVSTEGMSSVVLRVPGAKYYNTQKEELLLAAPEQMKRNREIFGYLMR